MFQKSTEDLTKLLKSTHPDDMDEFLKENASETLPEDHAFSNYVKAILLKKELTLQTVFLKADIPERYGYKLISGEKVTRRRDIILRLCYAAEFTVDETQRALEIYGMPKLYPRQTRDQRLITLFNTRPGNILDLNEYLKRHKLDPLRTSGVQD